MTHPAVTVVRLLAEEQPDRISKCLYVRKGAVTPECIIGNCVVDLGGTTESLGGYEGSGPATVLRLTKFPIELGSSAVEWLEEVQRTQDNGSTWGTAVKDADLLYPEMRNL